MHKIRKIRSLFAALVALLITAGCYATSYDASAGSSPGYSFTASGPAGTKTVAGYTALGVQGGHAGNEIDAGEWLRVQFDAPQIVDALTLGFLFNGPEYQDPYERAVITSDASSSPAVLTAIGDTFAWWTGSGTVENVSPAVLGAGGVWTIYDPFGGVPVNSIVFTTGNLGSSPGGSDYGLAGFRTHSVPDGGSTLAFLGLALLGLPMLRRK